MRSDGVVMSSPLLDEDFGLMDRVENFAIEQLVAETAVEAFHIAVLPGAAGRDEGGLCADGADPVANALGDELRAIIRADEARRAAQDEKVGQNVDHVSGLEFAVDPDRQTFAAELIENAEHLDDPAIRGAVVDEVVAPDMVGAFRPQPDAGAVIQPQPFSPRLPRGDLQPLATP